jgi:hypothetical protein
MGRRKRKKDESLDSLLALLFIPLTMWAETNRMHIPTTYDAFWKVL